MSVGGAIKVKPAEYFLNNFIHLHGEDVTLFGEGHTRIVNLKRPYTLSAEAKKRS